ncbi:uncharacterized protein LOC142230225 [Haematobia irritans]|uniref:uncharacterized protein LOC142230225 n=1 Tax=Haematobia irritans TaxID=7368 RepID=UPI003F4F58FE
MIDIIRNPPTVDRYSNLKNKLIERYTLSEQKRLDKLFSDTVLGDRRPSDFFRSLKLLAGSSIDVSFVKSLWLKKLPRNLNIALIGSNISNIESLLTLADRIWEVSEANEVDAVESSCPSQNDMSKVVENLVKATETMCDKMNQMSLGMVQVQQEIESIRFGNRSGFREKQRTRTSNRKWLCRYHYRFGDKARKCEQTCAFSEQGN